VINHNDKTLTSFVTPSSEGNRTVKYSKDISLSVYLPVCESLFWDEKAMKRLPQAIPPVRLVERYLICHKTFWNSFQEAIGLSASTASMYASTAIMIIMIVIVNLIVTDITSPAEKQERMVLHTRECLRMLKEKISLGYFQEHDAMWCDHLIEAAFPHHEDVPVEPEHAEKAAKFKRDVRQRRARPTTLRPY